MGSTKSTSNPSSQDSVSAGALDAFYEEWGDNFELDNMPEGYRVFEKGFLAGAKWTREQYRTSKEPTVTELFDSLGWD